MNNPYLQVGQNRTNQTMIDNSFFSPVTLTRSSRYNIERAEQIVAVLYTVVGSFGVTNNGVFIVIISTMFWKRKLSWKRFWLVLNGAILDFVGALMLLAVAALRLLIQNGSDIDASKYRDMADLAQALVVLVPAVNYLAICTFQYVAIRYPILYATRVTKRKYIAIIICEWLLVLFAGLSAFSKLMVAKEASNGQKLIVQMVFESFRTAYMASTALGLTAIFGLVLLARIRNKRDMEVTLEHFVKNFGVNVVIFTLSMYALFVASLVRWPFYYKYISTKPSDPGNFLPYFENLSQLSKIKAISGLISVVWMARIVVDPLLHIRKHSVIRRFLSKSIRCRTEQKRVHAGYFPMQYVNTCTTAV